MSTLERPLAALESIVDQKQVRVVFAEAGETDDEAIAREGVDATACELVIVRGGENAAATPLHAGGTRNLGGDVAIPSLKLARNNLDALQNWTGELR